MVGGYNMGEMFLYVLLVIGTSSVSSKFCLNEECSEPISSARIKIPYKTKDVHLYSGDEVDILSKSDDGSFMEFEIGAVKGVIPTGHLKASSLKIDQDSLIHINEFDGDEDENGETLDMEGEDPDEYEGEVEELPNDFVEEDTKKVKKPKKMLGKLSKMGKTSVGPTKMKANSETNNRVKTVDTKSKDEQELSKMKKIEEKETHGDSKEDISIKQQVGEALAPGSKGNDKTDEDRKESGSIVNGKNNEIGDSVQASHVDGKVPVTPILLSQSATGFQSAIQKLDNFKIMKKRYIQDYLDTNYAGQDVNENTRKQVEDFIEGDMMEQLKDPNSDLLEMLLHYDPKDLPGERSGEDEIKEDGAIKNERGDTNLKVEDSTQSVSLEHGKEVPSIISNDTALKETVSSDGDNVESKIKDNEKTPMNSSTSSVVNMESRTETDLQLKEKSLVEGAEKAGQPAVAEPSDSDIEHGDAKQIDLKEKKQDFTQHPNFPALKKKYMESYLDTHYKGEEVSPHIKLMVENLISSDLLQQLQTDDVIREELFHLIPNADSEKAVKLEKDVVEETQTSVPGLDKPVDSFEPAMSMSAQNDNIKMTASVHNVIHSTAIKSFHAELTEAVPQTDVDESINAQTAKERYTSQMENETGTEPIPPAGGKDGQRHIANETLDEIGQEGSNERKTEETELKNNNENTLKDKDEGASKDESRYHIKDEIKEEQVDAKEEGLDRTEEDKATNEEDSGSNFSFKNLGNVLKDRFQALANQIIAPDEERTSQGDEESRSSEKFDNPENSEYFRHESLPDPTIVKDESLPESMKDADKETKKVLAASLDEEEESKVENIVPEFTEKQETSDVLSFVAKEKMIKDNDQSNETAPPEKELGDSDIAKDSEGKEELQKSVDVTEDNKVREESNKINHGIDLVSLTTTVPTSGSQPAKDSGDSPIVEEQPEKDALSSLTQVDGTNSIKEGEKLVPGEKSDSNLATEDQKLTGFLNIHENEENGTVVAAKYAEEGNGEKAFENPETKNPPDSTAQSPLEKAETDTGKLPNMKEPNIADDSTDNLKAEAEPVGNSHQSQEQRGDVKAGEKPRNGEEPVSAFGGSDSVVDPNDGDANVDILPDTGPAGKRSVDSNSEQEATSRSVQDDIDRMMKTEGSEADSKDLLLEMCNSQPSLPECDQLRGAKIYRGKREKPKEPVMNEEIGRLERASRNLMKIMKRIKIMKLGFVRLFHGPLSVMGLEDIFHMVHDQIEHASPEFITITTCCFLLIFILVMKSCFTRKHVIVGASAYDIHKMRQSKEKILRENAEDLENELKSLKQIIQAKDLEIDSGSQVYKNLENKLRSLQAEFDGQEIPSSAAHSKSFSSILKNRRSSFKSHISQSSKSSASIKSRNSNTLLETIRGELEEGKNQQKKLHEMMEEKEQEIQEADNMALRHQNEIERQKDISETLNDRLEKVVNELDLKDGIVLELQEKNGALRIELENSEMERRQMEKERNEMTERWKELEEQFKLKEEENGKLQDEMDEKENEIEVLRECMAQISNGKLDGEAVEDFDTPEEDPDIKEQLKTERLKQIVESTQALANLKKCEKDKEYFQEGYLEELDKREKAEDEVKVLKEEVEKLSKDVNTYKNSSTEYHIKLETLQHYFKQQETELHRKLSVEEQSRLDFQKKYENVIGQSNSALEETTTVKSQNDDLKNEIKEMERSIKEVKIAAEKETHELWIKNRQINRDLEEMKRERDIYRKRLLEAETAKKKSASPQLGTVEKSRDSPAGSDDGRPASPGSQKSAASGVPNFMIRPRPMFPPPPPPPPLFPPMRIPPMGPMPPQLPPFGQLPPMMGRPQVSMPSSGQPMGPVSGTSTGPTGFAQAPQSVPSGQFSNIPPPGHFGSPATTGFQNNPTMPPNYMEASSYNQVSAPQQPFSANAQSKPQVSRRDSQRSLTDGGGRQVQGQTTPVMQRRFQPQPSSTMEGPFQSTPINSPNMPQLSQLPPSHPSLVRAQLAQSGRPHLQNRTASSDLA